jgi:hypothetical protein
LDRGQGTLGRLVSEPGKLRIIPLMSLLLLKIKNVLKVTLHHLLLLMDIVPPSG